MAETHQPVQAVSIDYTCDHCSEGVMRPTPDKPWMLMSDPSQFPHQCTHCGIEVNLSVRYPTYGFVPLGGAV